MRWRSSSRMVAALMAAPASRNACQSRQFFGDPRGACANGGCGFAYIAPKLRVLQLLVRQRRKVGRTCSCVRLGTSENFGVVHRLHGLPWHATGRLRCA